MTEKSPIQIPILAKALEKRLPLFNDPDTTAFRLFNGIYEGDRRLNADWYNGTLVLQWMDRESAPDPDAACAFYSEALPDLRCVLLKNRFSRDESEKKGQVLSGSAPAQSIREWGVGYPVDLQLNKDCSFYTDSALLRKWLLENSRGKIVLNTFAYTGSLGAAAEAGGAASVMQTDMNRNYLKAERFPNQTIRYGDFFRVIGGLRKQEALFDIVILDPPFFSVTGGGRVNQEEGIAASINKIRPLVGDGGVIVFLNNALFLSGASLRAQLQALCGDYLQIREMIPVPASFTGGEQPQVPLPADPAPYNHPTKITLLDVRRKDKRTA